MACFSILPTLPGNSVFGLPRFIPDREDSATLLKCHASPRGPKVQLYSVINFMVQLTDINLIGN